MQSSPSCEQLNKRLQLYYTTNKAWRYVFTTRLPLKLGSGNGDSWSAFLLLFHENPESRTSVIAIPNIIFFLNPQPCLNFDKFRFPSMFPQIPHCLLVKSCIPSTFSRIPHGLLVKSRIPSTFSRIPRCLLVKSRIPPTFSRILQCLLVKSRIPSTFSRIPLRLLVKSRIAKIPFQTLKSVQDFQHCLLSCDDIFSHRSMLIEDQWYSWRIAQLPLPWEQIIQHHIQSRFCHGLFFSRNTPSSG